MNLLSLVYVLILHAANLTYSVQSVFGTYTSNGSWFICDDVSFHTVMMILSFKTAMMLLRLSIHTVMMLLRSVFL
jgi:hypothetical protein